MWSPDPTYVWKRIPFYAFRDAQCLGYDCLFCTENSHTDVESRARGLFSSCSSLTKFGVNSAWASASPDGQWWVFSALLRSCVCSKVQKLHFHSQCILVQAHRKVVGGNSGIPVTGFIIFRFYLILTGPSATLRVDSALSPAMFLILLLITSFCSLSFCTWCCFFHAGREGSLKSNLQILLYRAPCIPDRLSAVLQGFSWRRWWWDKPWDRAKGIYKYWSFISCVILVVMKTSVREVQPLGW